MRMGRGAKDGGRVVLEERGWGWTWYSGGQEEEKKEGGRGWWKQELKNVGCG